MALLRFDASQVEPNKPLEPIPAGFYNARIIESEMKPTKNQDGAYLALTLEILDGQYQGRKIFDRLNLQNPNAQAMEIAYRTLSAICHAVGVYQVNDSSELHGRPLSVKVSLRPAQTNSQTGDHYEAINEVKGYKAIEGSTAQLNTGMPPAAPPPQAPPPQAPPAWQPPPAAAPATPPPAAPAAPPPWAKAAPPASPAPPAAPPWTPPGAPAAGAPPPWARK
jgi:hypothetical protein